MERVDDAVARLLSAMAECVEAQHDYSRKADSYDGYSPDWAFRSEIERMDGARKALSDAFRSAVLAVANEVR